jgi:nitroreductase
MRFLELAAKRVSVRAYDSKPLPTELVDQVLEAGRLAPSACNKQPWHFIVITDPEKRKSLSEAYSREWFWTAPVIIVVCVDKAKAWTRKDGVSYAWVDAAIAVDHMTLCAADLGLGACWIGAFQDDKLREVLQLPAGIDAVAMLPLGFPKDAGRPKDRLPLDQIVHREKW